jgi:hypothetical protein
MLASTHSLTHSLPKRHRPKPDQFENARFSPTPFPNSPSRVTRTAAYSLARLFKVLANNQIQTLSDLEPLSDIATLERIVLLNNPVVSRPNYKLYLLHLVPSLKAIDYARITTKDRADAAALYGTRKAEQKKMKGKQPPQKNTFEIPAGGTLAAKSPHTNGDVVMKESADEIETKALPFAMCSFTVCCHPPLTPKPFPQS